MVDRDFYFIAHRGEYLVLKNGEPAGYAPEGSRPAYERVRDRKINGVKLDIHYTADKVVVMSHDPNLTRIAGQDLVIGETTLADLKKVPFLKVGEFANEKILTFDEALEIVKDVPLYYLDFKYYSAEMMNDVFATLDKHGIPRSKVIIATFNFEGLQGAQKLFPDIRRVQHISYVEQEDGTFLLNGTLICPDFAAVKAQMFAWKKELDLFGFNIPVHRAQTTPEFIRKLKANGCWLSAWFIHSTENADKFYPTGVNAFVTGMPSTIRDYLNSKK